ncbi:hypothetical protein KY284_034275 [Solanum tuberosum]|nr:hypothetical protein KY284_034275 [Solanum tuberosum]
MAKGKKEAEVERVKAKRDPKSVKKSLVKKDKVIKKALGKPKPVKGPGPSNRGQSVNQGRAHCRNGEAKGVEWEESLGIILSVPSEGISSIEVCKPASEFTEWATKRGDIKRAVPLGRGVPGTVKQMFSPATLLEYECAEGKVKGKSHVSDLLEQQASLKWGLNDLTVTLNAKEVEIARLKAQMQQTISKGPGTSSVDKEEVEKLRAENAQLLKINASLSEEV